MYLLRREVYELTWLAYSGEGSVAKPLVEIIIWRTQLGHPSKYH